VRSGDRRAGVRDGATHGKELRPRPARRERGEQAAVDREAERVPLREHAGLAVAARVSHVLVPDRVQRAPWVPRCDRIGRHPHREHPLTPAVVDPHVLADREPLRVAADRVDGLSPERDAPGARHERRFVDLGRGEREPERRDARVEERGDHRFGPAHRDVGTRLQRRDQRGEPPRAVGAIGIGDRDRVVRRGGDREVAAARDVRAGLLDQRDRVARVAKPRERAVGRAAVDDDHFIRDAVLRCDGRQERADVVVRVQHGGDQGHLHALARSIASR
jgi:hypothetical protein